MAALVQLMAFLLFGAKPLSEPMLPYCQLDPTEHISVKFYSKFKSFHSRNALEYVISDMAAILSQPQCVEPYHVGPRLFQTNQVNVMVADALAPWLHRQVISSHVTDYIRQVGACLPWKGIGDNCSISIWKNNAHKHMYILFSKEFSTKRVNW